MENMVFDNMYTVKQAMKELGLKQTQVLTLFKDYGVKKYGSVYFATPSEIEAIKNRDNKRLKLSDLSEFTNEYKATTTKKNEE